MTWDDEGMLDFNGLQNQIEQIIDKSEVQETLRTQLEEFDMLQSMFSNPKELEMDAPYVVDDIRSFVSGARMELPSRLDYRINLTLDGDIVEVYVNLPHDYPLAEPDLFVRGNSLTKSQQSLLNKDLLQYLSSFELSGGICIYPAITWLQENALNYLVSSRKVTKLPSCKSSGRSRNKCVFCRYWNYSPLIENKMKVKCIVEIAEACNVSGFCLKGKPAVICVEGCKSDCEEWMQRMRQMNWKHITCKRKEERMITTDDNLESFRRFNGFEEINFEGGKYRSKSSRHTDMGGFYKFLLSHNSGHVFKDLFGIEGSIVPSNPLRH